MIYKNWKRCTISTIAGGVLTLALSGVAGAAPATIKIAEPTWPGINVKTEVAQQLLETLGYKVEVKRLNLAFIYRGLQDGDTDVFFGGWLPSQSDMLDPAVKNQKIVKLTTNLKDAKLGLAVPDYVWKDGVHSVKDLAAHGDGFDRKIYGIESGSAMNKKFSAAVDNDYEGLGDWKVVSSSTAVMLTQVQRSARTKKPIVFFGWRPHWMNVKFDIRFLKDKKGSKIANIKSRVLTLTSVGFPKQQPNAAAFLRRFKVSAKTQSQWIYSFSHENEKKSDVAKQWLAGHEKTVAKWLKGVKTADDKSALAAYRKQYE